MKRNVSIDNFLINGGVIAKCVHLPESFGVMSILATENYIFKFFKRNELGILSRKQSFFF